MADEYTPQPFALNGFATPTQAVEYYREEFLRIVGEVTSLRGIINQQSYDLEIMREKVARYEAGDLNSPVRTDPYVNRPLTPGELPKYTYNIETPYVVLDKEPMPEGTACPVPKKHNGHAVDAKMADGQFVFGQPLDKEIEQMEGASCRH